jgi:PAS domain S-box-containing protein
LIVVKAIYLIAAIFLTGIFSHGLVCAAEVSFSESIHQEIQKALSDAEKAWMLQHKTIRIAGPQAFPPFHYYEEDGTLKGMAPDYINLIFKYLEITPQIRSRAEWPIVLKEAKERKIDLIACAAKTIDREQYLGFTQPFLSFPLVIIAKKDAAFIGGLDDLHGKKVAFIEGNAAYKWMQRERINPTPYFVKTPLEALKTISLGQADAHIENLATATYLIQKYGLANLKIAAPAFHENYNLYMAVRKDWPEFVSIISKTLAVINPQQHSDIRNRWLSVRYEYGRLNPGVVKWILGGSGVTILVFLFILMRNRQLNHEILERKMAEAQLKKRKEELDSIFRAAPTGIGFVSDRRLLEINDRICEMTGYAREELVGQNARILYPTDEAYEYVGREKYRQIKRFGTGTVETQFKRKDGEIIHVLMSSTPLDPSNHSTGVTFTVLDITERKQTEAQLRKSEEQYRNYFEENISGSYISSPDGRLIACNREYERIFGFESTAQALKVPIGDLFVDPNQRAEFLALLKQEKRVTGFKPVLKNIHGTPIHLVENASSVFSQDGNLKHIRGFLLDVTEQKKLESQLQRAQRIEAIGTLAGGIAHDFNNILFPILGHTEILLEDVPEDSPVHNRLEKIFKSATRAKDLVQQILIFSRQDKFELKSIQLQPIVKEALKFIRSTIPTTIEIIQEISKTCGNVRADATQIYQVVMNLTTNAYHSMDETGGKLRVTLKEVEIDGSNSIDPDMDPGTYACLTVSDTGTGMEKEMVAKIFDPFFTTKEKGKGTGMGLSVVHGIVSSMNGVIQVESIPGTGTWFRVYLPMVESPAQHQKSPTAESIEGGTETILLVDDEADIVQMEKQRLMRLGYQVFSYTDSIQALEIFRTAPDKFDMVISDVAMPNMSGDILAKELITVRPDIPIVLCTGFSEKITPETAQEMGVRAVLMKPVPFTIFSKKIRDVLDGGEA